MLRWRYLCLIFLLSAVSFANPLDIRQYLKGILESQLSALVSKNVTIGQLRGNLYSAMVLYDVKLVEPDGSAAAQIARAEITYSLLDIVLQKFDVLSNIKEISLFDSTILVQRDREDKWNYSFSSKPADPQKKAAQPKMRVSFVNSSLHYIDEKGFGRRLPRAYDQTARLNGWLDINNTDLDFSVEATIAKNTSVKITGQLGQDQQININASGVELAEHGWYALSFSEYALSSGRADINAAIQRTGTATPSVEVALRLREADFQPSDYLTRPLQNINGNLFWRGDRLQVNNLRAAVQDAFVTVNGAVVLGADPLLDLQAEISAVDLQKKYSKYVSWPELSGQASARVELKGRLSKLSGSGELSLEDVLYANTPLGDLTAEVSLQDNAGEVFFHSPAQADGRIAFQINKDKILADVKAETQLEFYQQTLNGIKGAFVWADNKLRTEEAVLVLNNKEIVLSGEYDTRRGYDAQLLGKEPGKPLWLDVNISGDLSQNITVQVRQAALALQENALWQAYFPDGSGQINLNGQLFWRNKHFGLDGDFTANNIKYSDLQIQKFSGKLKADEQSFTLTAAELELPGSQLRGQIDLQLTAGEAPLWQRTDATVDVDAVVDLARAYDFVQQAVLIYTDIQKRLSAEAQLEKQIMSVRLPDRPLYLGTGDSVLEKFAEYIPSAAAAESLALDIRGQLSGRTGLQFNKGRMRLEQDMQIIGGVFQGQKVDLLQAKAHTDQNGRVSANISFAGLTVGGVRYDRLSFQTLTEEGIWYFSDFNLLRNKRAAKNILSGKFPAYGFWDERYREEEIDLTLRLSGEDLVLFTPFLKGINAVTSSGNAELVLNGTLRSPRLSARALDLTNTKITLHNPYIQEILVRRAALSLLDNKLTIAGLETTLRSYDQYTPILNLSGTMQILGWTMLNPEQINLRTDLCAADTKGKLNIRNLYNGEFELQNVELVGDLLFPLKADAKSRLKKQIQENEPIGPNLTGSLGFANGTLYLFKIEKDTSVKSEKNTPIQLDLDLNIHRDVRAQSGDSFLLTGEFSSFFNQINVAMRDENPPIKISGSTNFVRIDGRIFLDEGYISFINRKFTLLDTREQEKYFMQQTLHRPQDNYLEFAVTEKFTLDPRIVLVAQTTVYDTVAVSTAPTVVSGDPEEALETQMITIESDYLVFLNGSIFDLSSIAFEKYKRENLSYVLDGEPYILRDPVTGKMIDQQRFQELTYAISPPFIKSAIALARGTGTHTMNEATRETLRDLTITEINLLMRTLLKPAERAAAEWAGLYDVRIKRDLGQDAARLANLETQTTLANTGELEDELPEKETLFGLELIKELWKERLYFSVDTNIDRNLRTKNINITVNSYKLTWKILRNYFIDELSLNAGNELDVSQSEYIPILSLELLHSF